MAIHVYIIYITPLITLHRKIPSSPPLHLSVEYLSRQKYVTTAFYHAYTCIPFTWQYPRRPTQSGKVSKSGTAPQKYGIAPPKSVGSCYFWFSSLFILPVRLFGGAVTQLAEHFHNLRNSYPLSTPVPLFGELVHIVKLFHKKWNRLSNAPLFTSFLLIWNQRFLQPVRQGLNFKTVKNTTARLRRKTRSRIAEGNMEV